MEKEVALKKLQFAAFYATSLWAIFTVLWFFRDSDYRNLYTTLGGIYTISLAISGYYIGKMKKWAWRAATILVAASILLSIFDQIGLVDVVFITISSALLYILIKNKEALFN